MGQPEKSRSVGIELATPEDDNEFLDANIKGRTITSACLTQEGSFILEFDGVWLLIWANGVRSWYERKPS